MSGHALSTVRSRPGPVVPERCAGRGPGEQCAGRGPGAGAYRVYADPAEMLARIDETGVRFNGS